MKCANCGRDVIPIKKFNWILFIVLILLWIVPSVLYLIYFFTKTPRECPVCGLDVYSGPGIYNNRETAYVEWVCLNDKESCDACKAMDGTCWIPGMTNIPLPPLPSCKSPEKCRCVGDYVQKQEAGAVKTTEFIRKLGGKATPEQMDNYFKSLRK